MNRRCFSLVSVVAFAVFAVTGISQVRAEAVDILYVSGEGPATAQGCWSGPYVGLATDADRSNVAVAIKRGGGADVIYYDGSQFQQAATGWMGTYSAITGDPLESDRYYAAKPGGGVDILYLNS